MVRNFYAGKPDGPWGQTAKNMTNNFSDSGYPIYRASSSFERGELKKQLRWKEVHTLQRYLSKHRVVSPHVESAQCLRRRFRVMKCDHVVQVCITFVGVLVLTACSFSSGFGPNLTTMTKVSAGFSASLQRTSSLLFLHLVMWSPEKSTDLFSTCSSFNECLDRRLGIRLTSKSCLPQFFRSRHRRRNHIFGACAIHVNHTRCATACACFRNRAHSHLLSFRIDCQQTGTVELNHVHLIDPLIVRALAC